MELLFTQCIKTFFQTPEIITDLSVFVGSEVLTAGVILWDIKPCSLLKVNRRFGGTYRLHIQGQKISGKQDLVFCSVYSSTLKMEAIYSSETSTFNGLHGLISQKIVLFLSVNDNVSLRVYFVNLHHP
jgi:hypothetical protein